MMNSAKVIQVIETISNRGKGVDGDPIRPVTHYWSLEGVLLAEDDPCVAYNGKVDDGEYPVRKAT